jgi:hypothetical protein
MPWLKEDSSGVANDALLDNNETSSLRGYPLQENHLAASNAIGALLD